MRVYCVSHRDEILRGKPFNRLPSDIVWSYIAPCIEVVGYRQKKKGIKSFGDLCSDFGANIKFVIGPKKKFINKDVYIKVMNTASRFTSKYQNNQILKINIAHNEGNYYINDDELINNANVVMRTETIQAILKRNKEQDRAILVCSDGISD